MGSGSSGPQRLDPQLVMSTATSTTGGIPKSRLAKNPNRENFKGGRIRIYRERKSNSMYYLFFFIYLLISLLLMLYLYNLSRIKK